MGNGMTGLWEYVEQVLPSAVGDAARRTSTAMTLVTMVLLAGVHFVGPELVPAVSTATWVLTAILVLAWALALVCAGSYQLLVERERAIDKLRGDNRLLGDKFARVVFIYEDKQPFAVRDVNYFRVGVKNLGPAWADSVKVFLEQITPVNPLKDFVLPIALTYKDGGTARDIETTLYRALDVLKWEFNPANDHLAVWLCTELGLLEFDLPHGGGYRLHLVIGWKNAREVHRGEFIMQRERDRLVFRQAAG